MMNQVIQLKERLAMKIQIRNDSVRIEGYVNAIERNSKPLRARTGERFIERICKGAFFDALKRNDDVHVLLNHEPDRDLGSTRSGNLELCEDNIGLFARADITDPEVIDDAKNGNLVGWSFGFRDIDVDKSQLEDGMPLRKVKALDLREVSILNRRKTPAYDGTSIIARADEEADFIGESFEDQIETIDKTDEEPEERSAENDRPEQEEHPDKAIDYSKYEEMISEMKGEKTNVKRTE